MTFDPLSPDVVALLYTADIIFCPTELEGPSVTFDPLSPDVGSPMEPAYMSDGDYEAISSEDEFIDFDRDMVYHPHIVDKFLTNIENEFYLAIHLL